MRKRESIRHITDNSMSHKTTRPRTTQRMATCTRAITKKAIASMLSIANTLVMASMLVTVNMLTMASTPLTRRMTPWRTKRMGNTEHMAVTVTT